MFNCVFIQLNKILKSRVSIHALFFKVRAIYSNKIYYHQFLLHYSAAVYSSHCEICLATLLVAEGAILNSADELGGFLLLQRHLGGVIMQSSSLCSCFVFLRTRSFTLQEWCMEGVRALSVFLHNSQEKSDEI